MGLSIVNRNWMERHSGVVHGVLLQCCYEERDPLARREYVRQMTDPVFLKLVAVVDPDLLVRFEALEKLDDEDFFVNRAVQDHEEIIRVCIVMWLSEDRLRALAKVLDGHALSMALELLDDEGAVLKAFARIHSKQERLRLTHFLHSSDMVREAAAVELSGTQSDPAVLAALAMKMSGIAMLKRVLGTLERMEDESSARENALKMTRERIHQLTPPAPTASPKPSK